MCIDKRILAEKFNDKVSYIVIEYDQRLEWKKYIVILYLVCYHVSDCRG